MAKTKRKKNTSSTTDIDAISSCHDDLLRVFQKHKLTVKEIVVVYGNLGYSLGASVEGYKEFGPSPDEVQQKYYSGKNSIGNALMMQGMLITTWSDQIDNNSSLDNNEVDSSNNNNK